MDYGFDEEEEYEEVREPDFESLYMTMLWNYMSEIDVRLFRGGFFLPVDESTHFTREETLNKLRMLSHNKYDGRIYEGEDIFIRNNILMWIDDDGDGDLIWALSPVKMALVLKEYELAGALLDMGYPISLRGPKGEKYDICMRSYFRKGEVRVFTDSGVNAWGMPELIKRDEEIPEGLERRCLCIR